MNELTLTNEQALALIALLLPLVIYLWTHLGAYQLHSKPKIKPEGNHSRRLTNANYGAYIQAQGRYYN